MLRHVGNLLQPAHFHLGGRHYAVGIGDFGAGAEGHPVQFARLPNELHGLTVAPMALNGSGLADPVSCAAIFAQNGDGFRAAGNEYGVKHS